MDGVGQFLDHLQKIFNVCHATTKFDTVITLREGLQNMQDANKLLFYFAISFSLFKINHFGYFDIFL